MTQFNPPAKLVWDDRNLTEHEGQRWMLFERSANRGKSGWSGTDEWHLSQPVDDAGVVPDPEECRWVACPGRKGLARAKKLAAWIVANQEQADRMTMSRIEAVVFPEESPFS